MNHLLISKNFSYSISELFIKLNYFLIVQLIFIILSIKYNHFHLFIPLLFILFYCFDVSNQIHLICIFIEQYIFSLFLLIIFLLSLFIPELYQKPFTYNSKKIMSVLCKSLINLKSLIHPNISREPNGAFMGGSCPPMGAPNTKHTYTYKK